MQCVIEWSLKLKIPIGQSIKKVESFIYNPSSYGASFKESTDAYRNNMDGLGEVSLASDTSYNNLSSPNKAEIARRSKL